MPGRAILSALRPTPMELREARHHSNAGGNVGRDEHENEFALLLDRGVFVMGTSATDLLPFSPQLRRPERAVDTTATSPLPPLRSPSALGSFRTSSQQRHRPGVTPNLTSSPLQRKSGTSASPVIYEALGKTAPGSPAGGAKATDLRVAVASGFTLPSTHHASDIDALASALDAVQAAVDGAAVMSKKFSNDVGAIVQRALGATRPLYRQKRPLARTNSAARGCDMSGRSPMAVAAEGSMSFRRDDLLRDDADSSSRRPVSPRRRHWIRQRFLWAVGRVLHSNRLLAEQRLQEARREIAERRLRLAREADFRRLGERRRACATLFANVHLRLRATTGKAAPLTAQKYAELQHEMRIINADLVLGLSEITKLMSHDNPAHAKFDTAVITNIFRKLDKDHSGYLELDELVFGLYPSATTREVRVVRESVEAAERARTKAPEMSDAQRLLASEFGPEVQVMFAHCDRSKQGSLSQEDLALVIADKDWRVLLGIDDYFSRESGEGVPRRMPLAVFADLVKYAFPPFVPHVGAAAAGSKAASAAPIPTNAGLPKLVLEAQAIATSSID